VRSLSALQRRQRDAPLRPWLFRIAHNEAISLIRRRDTASTPVDVSDRSAPSAEESATERAHLALLVSDLRELPERQRSALLLRELSGLSHREIAVALEISMHTVKHAIADGRRSLAEQQEGRTMRCQSVRQSIANHDKRVLRSMRVRAHLRDCPACAAIAESTRARETHLRLLVPPLAPLAAAGLLAHVHAAAGTHSATSVAGGLFAGASGKSLGAAFATKTLATAAIVVTTAATATAGAKLLTASASAGDSARIAGAARHAAAPALWAWRDHHSGPRHHDGSSVGVPYVAVAVAAVPVPAAPAAEAGSGAAADLQLGQADAQQASATPETRLVAAVDDQLAPPSDAPQLAPNTSPGEDANTGTSQAETGQTGEAPAGEGQGENAHSREGHAGEGHAGEGHGGEGRSGEGHGGEGHGGERTDRGGEGHPRGVPANTATAHSHPRGREAVPGSQADEHRRSQEGIEHAPDRGPSIRGEAPGETGLHRAGPVSSGPPEGPGTPATQSLKGHPVGTGPEGHPEVAGTEGHPAGADQEGQPAGADHEGQPAGTGSDGQAAGTGPEGHPAGGPGVAAESAAQLAGGTVPPAAQASQSAAPGGPARTH
jgi:RNA polymerase sigma factor (sigma-70 family)